MAWALGVILVVGVGLPIAAWRLSRHLNSRLQPVGGVAPPTDQVDKWLLEQHHLPALQRRQVRHAVTYGRAVRDPALRQATRDLAVTALRRELKLGRSIRIATYVMLANGLGVIMIGVFAWVATGSPAVVVAVLLGAWWLVRAVLAMKAIRRGPARAYQLNA
jgi:Flp pilus assembly protein TadB